MSQELKGQLAPVSFTEPPVPLDGIPTSLDELPIGSKILVELTNVKDGKRIVIIRGKFSIRPTAFNKEIFFFVWNKMAYYIEPKKIIKVSVKAKRFSKKKGDTYVLKLIFHILYSEALNADGSMTWSEELEGVLVDSGADQYITAATMEQGFSLTPNLIKTLMIIGTLGAFFGLAINGVFHLTPSVVIHWIASSA